MTDRGVIGDPTRRRPRPAGSSRWDWARLLRAASPEEALETIAQGFADPEDLELTLAAPGDVPEGEARFAGSAVEGPVTGGIRSRVPGRAGWVLTAGRFRGRPPSGALVRRAAEAIGAWRDAWTESSRAESRLTARARELWLLESLGRQAAESRSAGALFGIAAQSLAESAGAELVIAVHRLERSPLVDAFLARPFDDAALARLSRRGLEIAGEPTTEDPEMRSHLLPTYEAACGPRGEVQDHETAMAPLVARGRVVAALGIVTIAPVGERELRLFFSTVNQVSLHLDRILAVAEAEKNRFRSMLDSMPQSVLLADRQLRVIEANAAARRLVEQAGLLDDAGRIARVGDLDLIAIAGSVTRTCAPHGPFEAKLSDGTLLTLTASALRGDPGDTEGLVLVLTDVTESRQLQAQLAQAEKLSTIGELVSGIAHELNNPLASVLGYAQLLESAAADPRVSKRVGIIHAEARRCQKIVQNLLSFARRHDPERKPFSLNEVVESVLGLMAYQLRVANVRVERALDPELPSVLGDAHQIRQVVLNLVTNAYQAIRDTGREGRVLVRTSVARPGWVDLIVQDDGPGIAEADRGRIFDPFFTTKGAGQGTGLGLSLASGTVTAHGGRIEVESKVGEGAIFRVELPVGTAPAAASDPSFRLDETDPCTPSRILVVDDEDPIANLIFETLTSEGHHVRVAHTGNEALGLLTSEPFDLVVADVRMPGLGGTRLHEEMERIRPGISRRIVLTTGDFLGHEAKALADRTGADVLLKPFDLAELRRAVRARLRACGGN